MKISIAADYIVTMNENLDIIKNGVVNIENDRITYVGSNFSEFDKNADITLNRKKMILLPGLINSHTHLAISTLRGLAENKSLIEWLEKELAPYQWAMTFEDQVVADYLGCCELINSGVTCVADFFGFSHIAPVIEKLGLRGVLNFVVMDRWFDNVNYQEFNKRDVINHIKAYNNSADGKISCFIGPHAPYSCSFELMQAVAEVASELKIGITTHVAEAKEEIEWVKKNYGCTPIKLLDSAGLLTSGTLAVHCVHLNKEDLTLLSANKVKVAHCPISNAKLGVGIAPIREMLDNDIIISIGTDSVVSNNNFDLFAEMKFASLAQNIRKNNSGVIKPIELLKAVTIDGAKVLNLEKLIGSIEVGKKADLIMLNYGKSHLAPLNNIYTDLVYSAKASDVEVVIVDGKIIKDTKLLTIDEDEILKLSEKSINGIKQRNSR